jgi:molybdate transport system substrate-binding protein
MSHTRTFLIVASVAAVAVHTPISNAATRRTTTTNSRRTTAVATSRPARSPIRAPASTTRPPTTTVPVTGSVSVFAAQSLGASFTDIAAAFEKAHPGAKVTMSFGGSPTLVTQISNGAQADVFAAADTNNMDKLVSSKLVSGSPVIFTKNKLMIVVPKGNPLRVKGLADLARTEVFVALGAPGVPAGDYARHVLDKAGLKVTPRTLESNVAAIINKAALKEIDAGIVYVTDVAIDDYRVDGVEIPEEQNVIATYPIAEVSESRNPAAATSFVAFVQSPPAQAILKSYKFQPLK